MRPDIAIETPNLTAQTIKNRKQDTVWVLSLYGTAIGAGTLFLPIDAGLHGIWPLVIISLLAFPMTYLSHQALCRFVLSSASYKNDITDVVDEHFGSIAGHWLTFLYFFAIYPILLMYSVAITNTTHSFMINQLGLTPPPRVLLSLLLIAGLMTVIRFGQTAILKSMSILVYPFIAALILLSLYLIPHWNTAMFNADNAVNGLPDSDGFLKTLWLAIPVMVFSFNHSPIISSFAVNQKQRFGEHADKKSATILKYSHIMMITTVLFFVFSCVLSLSPQDLLLAKQQNISILSYLANHFETPIIAYAAPIIALVAISKSFLGHYLGASEGLQGLMMKTLRKRTTLPQPLRLKRWVELFIILTCWITATINPNILNIIETLAGPIIAIFLFLMPMYAMMKVPNMKKYRHALCNTFITTMGLIALSAIFYGLWVSISDII